MSNDVTRRDFLKSMALSAAAAAAATVIPGVAFAGVNPMKKDGLSWHKAPCRFCGTGCGLLIGIKNGRAVAVKGDPASPVNRGLCCVKGYHSIETLYAKDRLKKAMVRKNGKLVEVELEEALDLIAKRFKDTIEKHGKDAVAMYGSGQWAIVDGYAASKFMKGGIGTNNLEANARLCMASAVTGFLTGFGMDEPMGCYQDLDIADVFVMWGNNMAEMHPVLFSRILENRRKNPHVKIIDLCTRLTRTSEAADTVMVFNPQTDLAIANAICHELVKHNWLDWNFIKKHTLFKKGKTNIGYGLEDKFAFKDKLSEMSFEEFKKSIEKYTPEYVEELSGVPAEQIRYLAGLYGNPNLKVMSLWCMGMNQHTRGTWINNLVYNIHLLTGKISKPGNSPFSLTGQPSACGTVREVGTLTHKLPYGVVMSEKARKKAAKIWKIPVERIDPKPSNHTMAMFRALDRGDIRTIWIQCTNPMVTLPKLNRYRDGAKKEDRFIIVSDIYPTRTTEIADVVLPAAMWIEREGFFGNAERRTQHHIKMVEPPSRDCLSDMEQIIEVARRMGLGELFDYPQETITRDLFEEYRQFHDNTGHDIAPYDELVARPGVQWPYVNGKEVPWRYNEEYDPFCKPGSMFDFYGNKSTHRAHIIFRPYEPPPEIPDEEYPMWLTTGRIVEHWHTGSMTRRVPDLYRAAPEAYIEIHPDDAAEMRISEGDLVAVISRRGKVKARAVINGRGKPPRGTVFVPFFDENLLINEVTLDAYCPISKQPDYKKAAVRIERIGYARQAL